MNGRIRLKRDGQTVSVYDSVTACANHYGISRKTIYTAISRGTRLFGKYHVEYFDDRETRNIKSVFMRKPFT